MKMIDIRGQIGYNGDMSNYSAVKDKTGKYIATHGLSKHPLYRTWMLMMHRCYHINNPRYSSYGGRGITVYLPWHNVVNFINDIDRLLGPKPTDLHTLDRTNNNRGYAPGNIRWADKSQQAQNRRTPITNTSGFKGIHYDPDRDRWVVRVTVDGKRKRLGRFKTLEEARERLVI